MAHGDVIINIPAEFVEPITSMGQGVHAFSYGLFGLAGAIANNLQPYINTGVQALIDVSSPYVASASSAIKTTAIDFGIKVYDISGNVVEQVYTLPRTIGLKTGILQKKTHKFHDIEAQNEWCVLNDTGELIILESDSVTIQIEN
jgi:hypothetical protein